MGSYSLATPPLGTGADAGNQQRGGARGVVTPTTTVATTSNLVSGGKAPSPTQDGLVASFNNYTIASAGDGCFSFASGQKKFGLSRTKEDLQTRASRLGLTDEFAK